MSPGTEALLRCPHLSFQKSFLITLLDTLMFTVLSCPVSSAHSVLFTTHRATAETLFSKAMSDPQRKSIRLCKYLLNTYV